MAAQLRDRSECRPLTLVAGCGPVLLCRYEDDSGRRIAPVAVSWRANEVYITTLALLGAP